MTRKQKLKAKGKKPEGHTPEEKQKLMQLIYGYGPIRLYTTSNGYAVVEVQHEGRNVEVIRTYVGGEGVDCIVDETVYPLEIADLIAGVRR